MRSYNTSLQPAHALSFNCGELSTPHLVQRDLSFSMQSSAVSSRGFMPVSSALASAAANRMHRHGGGTARAMKRIMR